LRDEEGALEKRIESLDSTRVEDMVREYFAKADEVGLSMLLLFACISSLKLTYVSGHF